MDEKQVLKLVEDIADLTKKLKDNPLENKTRDFNIANTVFIPLESLSMSLKADSKFTVQVFGSKNDKDDQKIIGSGAEAVIKWTEGNAWVKYSTIAEVSTQAKIPLKELGFELEGAQSVIFSSYLSHSPEKSLFEAITADTIRFPTIARVENIISMKENDCLAMHLRGKLKAGVRLRWSDIFSSSLGSLSRLLNNKFVGFKVESGAKADFNISLSDDFTLLFTKAGEDKYRAVYKKCLTNELSVRAGVGVEVQFTDPKFVENMLNEAVDQLVKHIMGSEIVTRPTKTVHEILEKNNYNDLTKVEKEFLEKLFLEVFDTISDIPEKLAVLKQKWTDFEQKIKGTIIQIATAKVTAGITYEYTRISRENAVFQAVFSAEALRKYHWSLFRMRTDAVINDLKDNPQLPGVVLEEFLNEKTFGVKKTWGFSLRLNRWELGGKNHSAIKKIIRESKKITNQGEVIEVSVGYEGLRSFEEVIGRDKSKWWVDFKADMQGFNTLPTAADFEYGLFFGIEWQEHKFPTHDWAQKKMPPFVDNGVVCRVVPDAEAAALSKSLTQEFKGDDFTFSCQVKIDNNVFRKIIGNLPKGDDFNKALADALAVAMPYYIGETGSQEFEIRKSAELRKLHYSHLWLYYITKYKSSELYFIAQVVKYFNDIGQCELAEAETSAEGESYPIGSFMYMAGSFYRSDWRDFQEAAAMLHRAIQQRSYYDDVIEEAYKGMRKLFSKKFYIRALMYFLLRVAEKQSVAPAEIEKIFSITYVDESGREVTRSLGMS